MGDGVIAAFIGALATIAAAVLGFIANSRKARAIASLANVGDRRSLSTAEVQAIKVQASVAEQLGAAPPPEAVTGEVLVKLVFPGSSSFKGGDRDVTSTIYYSTSFSDISVTLDGETIGSGSGESGFQLNFKTDVGRHTLLFSWTGETTRYSDSGSRDTDKSGRREVIMWFVRGGRCAIHLDGDFQVDHVEPSIVLPVCYTCRMPGVNKCRCGRKYCGEHAAVYDSKQLCVACKEEAIQRKLTLIRRVLFIVGGVAVVAALYFWLF